MGERPTRPSPASPPPSLPVLVIPHIASRTCAAERQRACRSASSGQILTRWCSSSAAPLTVDGLCLSETAGIAPAMQPTYLQTYETPFRNCARPRPESVAFASGIQQPT